MEAIGKISHSHEGELKNREIANRGIAEMQVARGGTWRPASQSPPGGKEATLPSLMPEMRYHIARQRKMT
jgi:hypothetical protein